MKFYTYVLLLGAVLITGVFLTSTLAQSFSTPLYRPIVVVFGDSSEVETAVHTLVADFPSALVINYQDIHSLVSVLTLIRSHSPLILVGHGSEYGILGPDNVMISWQDISTWVNTLPTTFVFFLACDSNGATKFVQIPSYGFSGTIDGVLGAITVAANLQYANGNMQAVQHLLSQYVSRVILLQSDKTKILPLICYYGPAQSSPGSSNSVSPNTICPPPPPPPPTYYITFTESGLPSDTSWSVTLNGATKSARVDAAADPSSISFGVNAGTYSYSISSPYGYSPTPSSGTVSAGNGDVRVSITYSQIIFTATFTESGLQNGASWSVTLNGVTASSSSSSISFSVYAGTYSYSISTSEAESYDISLSSGSVSVNSNIGISIIFTPHHSWSSMESGYWIVMAYVTFMLILGDLALDPTWDFLARAAAVGIPSLGGILWTLFYLCIGEETLESTIGNVLIFLDDMSGFVYNAILASDALTIALFSISIGLAGVTLAAEFLLDTASGGTATMLKYVAGTAAIIALAAGIAGDYSDYNDYVG